MDPHRQGLRHPGLQPGSLPGDVRGHHPLPEAPGRALSVAGVGGEAPGHPGLGGSSVGVRGVAGVSDGLGRSLAFGVTFKSIPIKIRGKKNRINQQFTFHIKHSTCTFVIIT